MANLLDEDRYQSLRADIQASSHQVRPCVLVYGGSFDPVHQAHCALIELMSGLFQPNYIHLIPTGQPWQKPGMHTAARHRIAMLKLALSDCHCAPVWIDQQEVERAAQGQASYTIESLIQLRQQLGQHCSLIFAMGGDQLLNLHTWHRWQELTDYANLVVANRPGFTLEQLAPEVAHLWQTRASSAQNLRTHAKGATLFAHELALNVSATQLRQELRQELTQTGSVPTLPLHPMVLDYIRQHSLYSKYGH